VRRRHSHESIAAGRAGIKTTPTVDLSAAYYGKGSFLLCHDDDLASRRIAYIVYLVPEDKPAPLGPDGKPVKGAASRGAPWLV
jgi:Rps23 Pro-64 3,4-dihydroxylase Tpa1-like proline 4-hydroxylase